MIIFEYCIVFLMYFSPTAPFPFYKALGRFLGHLFLLLQYSEIIFASRASWGSWQQCFLKSSLYF